MKTLAKYHKDGGNGVDGGLSEAMKTLQRHGFDSRQIELYTPLELEELKIQSDENLVNFYKKELLAGLFGGISKGTIKQLKRNGVISHISRIGLRLTERGREVLK